MVLNNLGASVLHSIRLLLDYDLFAVGYSDVPCDSCLHGPLWLVIVLGEPGWLIAPAEPVVPEVYLVLLAQTVHVEVLVGEVLLEPIVKVVPVVGCYDRLLAGCLVGVGVFDGVVAIAPKGALDFRNVLEPILQESF